MVCKIEIIDRSLEFIQIIINTNIFSGSFILCIKKNTFRLFKIALNIGDVYKILLVRILIGSFIRDNFFSIFVSSLDLLYCNERSVTVRNNDLCRGFCCIYSANNLFFG